MGLSWTYDRYGNRTAQSVTAGSGPSNSVTVDPTTNRITGTGYGYDANGNMTNDGLNALGYDAENRLVTSSGSTYSYDGRNLRVKKVASGTATVYVFSGTQVIAEYVNGAAPTSPTKEYIYSGSALLATIAGSTTTYHHADRLSARVTTDTNGNVAGQQGHYPYGESWYAASATTKWQFTSYERDSESGNDYAMFRYYVNRLGRFSSPDPVVGSITDPQSLNRYAYTRNDPLNLTDPLGLDIESEVQCVRVCAQIVGTEENCTITCTRTTTYTQGVHGSKIEDQILTTEMWDDFHMGVYSDGDPGGGCAGPGCAFTPPGIRAPGQTWEQCMEQNANTYSAGGALELAANVATGKNTSVSSNGFVSLFTGNAISSFFFGSASDAAQSAATSAPDLVRAGMGAVTTSGRSTTAITSLNVAGRGGVPQALSSVPTRGLRASLGSVGRALSLGLSATVRWGIDIGLTGAEAIGCAIPAGN